MRRVYDKGIDEHGVLLAEERGRSDSASAPFSVSGLGTDKCAGAAGWRFNHTLPGGNCGFAPAGAVVGGVCAGWADLF